MFRRIGKREQGADSPPPHHGDDKGEDAKEEGKIPMQGYLTSGQYQSSLVPAG
jgi:hypothetical protein